MTDNAPQLLMVPREPIPGERRVAATPDTVKDLVARGFRVKVEPDAGIHALLTDDDYREAGADVGPIDLTAADIVVHVRPLSPQRIASLKPGAVTVGFATGDAAGARALRDGQVTALAMELVPRISRAQSMDALTS